MDNYRNYKEIHFPFNALKIIGTIKKNSNKLKKSATSNILRDGIKAESGATNSDLRKLENNKSNFYPFL